MDIRKILTHIEETFSEAGRACDPSLRKVAVVAVIKNPFAGRYVENLDPLIDASLHLGKRIAALAAAAMRPLPIESYGKAGLAGMAGEQGSDGLV